MAMNFPPPGQPPSGQPPGETPSTPRKKPKGLRATIYRATTHIKRATLGKDRAAKTEEIKEIKKKKKKVEANGLTVAPAPAPAPAPIFATIQHPGQPAIMTAPAMPAPVTQDDLNYHAYIQAQQLGNLAPYGVTPAQPPVQQMPAPIPVIVTATQQLFIASQPPQHSPPQPSFALSASQPAKVSSMGADWNTRASECMEELLARLENGDPDEISSGLAMMQDIAKERMFTGDTIDGWVAAALANYPLDALQKVIKHAIELLPTDSLLADSVRLGIKRMLVPLEIIKAITTGESERLTALSDILRACCNPAKWGSKKPDGMRANAMMRQWLNRALATLPDEQLHALNRQIGELGGPKEFTVLILDDLLATTYWKRVVRYAEAFDQ